MASEQFSLCWDNFHKNMSSGMNSMLENEDLVDVTLAVEGKYLKAHKMVLSVCSPYFKELFKTNPCKHPIVFMKDVSYVALSDLLQFMYQGEVQVSQENLTTFIKTAEALQIKGLTGDGNGSTDELNESQEDRVSHTEAAPIQVPRPKKIAPPPITTPPVKRQRISTSFDSTPIHTPQITTKTEPISSTPSTEQMIQFKMEPHDQPQTINLQDENPEDTFGDEQLEDNNAEDAEEYSMMEGNEEEPQAGTSTETAGEGQDNAKFQINARPAGSADKPRRRRLTTRMRFVVDGFVYHNNVIAGSPPLRYLGCAEHKKAGCRGRATIPVGGTLDKLKVTQPHNHPPDLNAEEKQEFLKELKDAVRSLSMENATLKKVYEVVAQGYPKGAREIPFKSVSSSLHRWRRNPNM